MTNATSFRHLCDLVNPKDDNRYAVISPPKEYKNSVEYSHSRKLEHRWELSLRGNFDSVLFFVTREGELDKKIQNILKHVQNEVYIIWPKQQSNIVTDIYRSSVFKHFKGNKNFTFVKGIFFDKNWRALVYKKV